MNEITQALAAGKEVIAHTDRISVSGWTGEGYILFDPVTGDGAYKITGGANGGFLKTALMKLQFYIGFWLSFAKNHPAIAKAIAGSIGYFLATIPLLIDIFDRCNDLGFAVLITTFFLLYNVAILLATIALAAAGVGFLLLTGLAIVEYLIERELRDYLIQNTSACRQ